MKKLCVFLAGLLLAGITLVQAQTVRITGTVTSSEDGMPMPGVSVFVKGTTIGITTDMDGKYQLNVPANAQTLTFSFVGYETQDVAIAGRSIIDVVMKSESKQIEEVMVVAYGQATKATFTGSAAKIDSKQLDLKPVSNITKALEGAAPGVQVTSASGQPGSGMNIRIRGFGSINASSDPLYVVDGVPYSGAISNLNPNDIESITVLKDAGSTALYGNRAANGVVVITTKKGSRDKNQMQVKVSKGYTSRAIPEYERVNPYQYYELMWEALRNSLYYVATPPAIDVANQNATNNIVASLAYNIFGTPNGTGGLTKLPDNQVVLTNGRMNPNAQIFPLIESDLDWQKELSRLGQRDEYALSIVGGSEKSDYFISLGYLNEKGYTIKSDIDRITGRVNVNNQVKKWLKTGLNLNTTITKSTVANDESSTGYVNPFFFSRNMGPIYPVYAHNLTDGTYMDENGAKIYDLGNMTSLGLPNRPSGASPGRHVIAETVWNDRLMKRNIIGARTYFEFNLYEGLKFTTNLSSDISNYRFNTFENTIVGDGAPAGRGGLTQSLTTSYNLNQLLTYTKSFGDHSFDVLLGHENYDWEYKYTRGFKQGLIVDGNTELINFTTINELYTYTNVYRSEGYFSRFNYSYAGKYFGSLSYRRDASSKFHPDNRWGDFWSVGFAWRADQENFIKQFTWLDMLKVKASYGELGNDGIAGYYPYKALYGLDYNNASEPGFLQTNLENRELTWESNNSFNVGAEFGFLKRFEGSIEFFHRISSNLLFSVPLPPSSGMESIDRNIGTMYNQGLELSLTAKILRSKDLNWDVTANFTTFKNEITKMPDTKKEIISGTKKLMEGHSVYDFWLRKYYGVNPGNGEALYYWDNTKSLPTDASLRIIGNDTLTVNQNLAKFAYVGTAIPDLIGSVSSNLSYKNFALSFLFTYQIGGKIYDGAYASLMHSGDYGRALHVDALNRWQKQGDKTDVPRMDFNQQVPFGAASDRWLTNATYVSLKNVNLSYTLPKSLTERLTISSASVYIAGDNLFLIGKRKGMDPQYSFAGVTSNVYSPSRVVTLGLNLTF